MHRVNGDDNIEFVLSYGTFTTQKEANSVLATLSQSNRRYGAYSRSFRSIKEEIKKLDSLVAQTASIQ